MGNHHSIASVVLVGIIGSGKTTLYNKITGAQERTQEGGKSVTRQIFSRQAAFSDKFKVLDTPGMGSREQKLHHYGGILAALSEGNVNRIIFVEKFARVDLNVTNVIEKTKPFFKYKHMITIIITHFDFSKNEQEDKSLILEELRKWNLDSVLFFGIKDNGIEICKKIEEILQKSEAQKVELEPDEYLKYFDLVELDPNSDELQARLEIQSSDIQIEFRKIATSCTNFIKNLNRNESDIPGLIQAIIDFAKSNSESLINEFLMKNDGIYGELQKLKNEHLMHLAQFELKQKLFLDIDKILNEAQQKLNDSGFKYHQYLRKCNYCEQIWFKVEGCQVYTYCGRVPSEEKDKDQFQKREIDFAKYKVTYMKDKKKVKLEICKEYVIKTEEEKKKIQNQLQELQQNQLQKKEKRKEQKLGFENCIIGEFGCGKLINWDLMDPITENEAKLLVDPGFLKLFNELKEKVEMERTLRNEQIQKNLLEAIAEQKQNIKND